MNDIDPTDTFDIETADPQGGNDPEPKTGYRVITGTMVDGVVTESTETVVAAWTAAADSFANSPAARAAIAADAEWDGRPTVAHRLDPRFGKGEPS